MKKFFLLFILNSTAWMLNARAQTWQIIQTGNNQTISEIEAIDSLNWLAISREGWIGRTSNQGSTWNNVQNPVGTGFKSFEKVHFPNLGIWKNLLVNSMGKLYRFDLPGQTLVADTLPYTLPPQIGLQKLVNLNIANNNDIRYGLLGDSGLANCYKFPWANPEFSFQFNTQKPLRDMYPFNTWNILVAGDSGKIWRTQGLANPFQFVNQSLTKVRLNRIFGQGNTNLWIAADSGIVLFSSNGGLNWEKRNPPFSGKLMAGIALPGSIWVCGENGQVFASFNLGLNWISFTLPGNQTLWDIKNLDGAIWVCGENGLMAKLDLTSHLKDQSPEDKPFWFAENQVLNIHFHSPSPKKIQLLNLQGKVVFKDQVQTESVKIPLHERGMYILHWLGNEKPQTILIVNP